MGKTRYSGGKSVLAIKVTGATNFSVCAVQYGMDPSTSEN